MGNVSTRGVEPGCGLLPLGEWRLHPEVLHRIWGLFNRAEVDLFTSEMSTLCPFWFSLKEKTSPLGQDSLDHTWPEGLLYAFHTLILPTLVLTGPQASPGCPLLASQDLVLATAQTPLRDGLAPARQEGPLVSDRWLDLASHITKTGGSCFLTGAQAGTRTQYITLCLPSLIFCSPS